MICHTGDIGRRGAKGNCAFDAEAVQSRLAFPASGACAISSQSPKKNTYDITPDFYCTAIFGVRCDGLILNWFSKMKNGLILMLKPFSFILVVLLITASCSRETSNLSAELRYEANRAYSDLTSHCERAALTERRNLAWADLTSDFLKLEKQVSGKLAGIDFTLAKQMSTYEAEADGRNNRNCGLYGTLDSEIEFAHEKRWFKSAIEKTEELSQSRLSNSKLPDWLHVKNAAKFRAHAYGIMDRLDPQCPPTVEQAVFPADSKARKALNQLRATLSGSAYGKHLEIAEADVEYSHSVTLVECSEPSEGKVGVAEMAAIDQGLVNAVSELSFMAGLAEKDKK
jgi:hypothetical protein